MRPSILEQVVKIQIESDKLDGIAELAMKNAAVFERAGQPESGAQILEKVALELKDKQPENFNKLLEKAADIVHLENRPIHSAFFINKLLQSCLGKL